MKPRVLHVGCGGDALPEWLGGYDEVRLDIDPSHDPDIVASMTDMGDIGPFDHLFCSHALEHLTREDAARALSEFQRVLKPGGAALVVVPDLEDVKPDSEVLFHAPAGPITGHDLYYGMEKYVTDNPHMAHRAGYVSRTLDEAMARAGFSQTRVDRIGDYNLLGVGVK